jgi:hypothetical protein
LAQRETTKGNKSKYLKIENTNGCQAKSPTIPRHNPTGTATIDVVVVVVVGVVVVDEDEDDDEEEDDTYAMILSLFSSMYHDTKQRPP